MPDELPNIIVVCFTSRLYLSSRIFKLIIQSHFCASVYAKKLQQSTIRAPSAHAPIFHMY